VVAGFAASSALTLLPAVAHADPRATAAQAQAQLQALADKAEVLTEQYNAAEAKLAASQQALAAAHDAIAKAQQRVDVMRAEIASIVTAAYESGDSNPVQALLVSGDPSQLLNRASTLSMLAGQRGRQLAAATAARNQLTQAQSTAAQQEKKVRAEQASLKQQQKSINTLVAQQQQLLQASKAQIAADNARQAAADRARRAAAAAAAASRAQARANRPADPAPATPVSASGRAAAALKYAYAQLGKPYRWAGAGPNSFDCSGLTMRAWQAAGVSLPHNAAAQYASTPHVSRSQLQPGDLVYFGHPIHHVGIYIGNGSMIEAPYTGANVRITNFGYRHDYVGASRP
jgi:cell wall-associated NlpC family hydrolase